MDESKLTEQAREFCAQKGNSVRYYPQMDNSNYYLLMADFARQVADEQVKSETTDLRKLLADAETAMQPLIYGCGHAADLDCPLGFDELHHFLTKLQENK